MKLRLLTILTLILYGTCAHGHEEDRAERRELRDRRDKIRRAIKAVENCFSTGDLEPCMNDADDPETRAAVMRYYLKRQLTSGRGDAKTLLKIK